MTPDEAFAFVKQRQPRLIHVSGKTSTGKSTFAARLRDELGYQIIELDTVVNDAVIVPLKLQNRGAVFDEVYKQRNQLGWIRAFTKAAQRLIAKHEGNGEGVVVDGAIANPLTLKELLSTVPETEILYFHPKDLTTYETYLTSRFMLANDAFRAGLPTAFWEQIEDSEFRQFCKDKVVTPSLQQSIGRYAAASRESSSRRLSELRRYFEGIRVVEI